MYEIIIDAAFWAHSRGVHFRTYEDDKVVHWKAQICRGFTDPRDDLDVMQAVIKQWGGWKRILELLKPQVALEVLWLKLTPEQRKIAMAEGDESVARLSAYRANLNLLEEETIPESKNDSDDVQYLGSTRRLIE